MNYNFEWDRNKANSNRAKHGVTFEEAATVFTDPLALSTYDDEHSENEDRWVTMGISGASRLLIVCHTFRRVDNNNVSIRIFSSRKATKNETTQYKG